MTLGTNFVEMPALLFRLPAVHAMSRDCALQLHLSVAYALFAIRSRRTATAEQEKAGNASHGNLLKPIEHTHLLPV
jgi:hypothetical protein